MNVSATMSQTDMNCMAIIKAVKAVKIDTHKGAATNEADVIAEYFSVAVNVWGNTNARTIIFFCTTV